MSITVEALQRGSNLRQRYGLTVEAWEQLFQAQQGACGLCGQPATNRRLNVDHDHSTGRIRGLLCNICNRAVGLEERYPGWLARAQTWIEEVAENAEDANAEASFRPSADPD